MTCYSPLKGYLIRKPDGSRKFLMHVKQGMNVLSEQTVSCDYCIGCRLRRSCEWATRCVHEASLWKANCWLTLTYRDEDLPYPPTLAVRPLQLFMKRVRKKYGAGIRFYACGEYGEKYGRPHYHVCMFNHDFDDKKHIRTYRDNPYYQSAALNELWPHGFSIVGALNFETAAYTARYVTKKIYGQQAGGHYTRVDLRTGEEYQAKPEFTVMSRRPGIARDWFEKYRSDVFPRDYVVIRGKKVHPPKYYARLYQEFNPEVWDEVAHNRYISMRQHLDNNTPERLDIRHELQILRAQKLIRNLEQ